MRANSLYSADCICGRHFETELRKYICPACRRQIVLHWGYDSGANPDNLEQDSPTVPELIS
jgi:hypothetical protein